MALTAALACTLAGAALTADVAVPAPVPAAKSELRVTESDGLALSAGIGVQYVLVGLQAAYYVQVPHTLYRIVPYAAFGGGWCGAADSVLECALSAGVMGSWGHKHRLFVDLGYGPLAAYSFSFHGEDLTQHAVSGPFAALGYEYVSFAGFVLRTELGAGYVLGAPLIRSQERTLLTLTLIGLGYKFW
jgi:hypothetical protein